MTAELDEVEIEFSDAGITVNNWTSYELNQHFLTPSDGWRFELGDERLGEELLRALVPGQRCRFRINGRVQGSGYIDRIATTASRSAGTVVTIEGRDVFAPVVDSCVDPSLTFTPQQTLEDVIFSVMGDFGFSTFTTDNDNNRSIQGGGKRGVPVSKKKGKPLKSYTLHQCKPYPGEGAFQFVSRIASREGLYVWPSADGKEVILARPRFDQAPSYTFRCKRTDQGGGTTNVLEASCERDWSEQPSAIVVTGRGDANFFSRSNLKRYIVNELVAKDPVTTLLRADVSKALGRSPTALEVKKATEVQTTSYWQASPVARVLYLHDDEAANIEQLEFFARRELAERQRKAFSYTLEVQGHTQDGLPYVVDTLANVDDDYNRVRESLYILARTFSKSRSGGTKTRLELIRPGTLELAPKGN